MNDATRLRPIIRWMGGKTKLLDDIARLIPSTYGTYFEPFIGNPQKAAVKVGLL